MDDTFTHHDLILISISRKFGGVSKVRALKVGIDCKLSHNLLKSGLRDPSTLLSLHRSLKPMGTHIDGCSRSLFECNFVYSLPYLTMLGSVTTSMNRENQLLVIDEPDEFET